MYFVCFISSVDRIETTSFEQSKAVLLLEMDLDIVEPEPFFENGTVVYVGNDYQGTFPQLLDKENSVTLDLVMDDTHKQSSKDDADLSTYNAFAVGALKGYGIIGVDRDTGLLVIAVKNNLTRGSIYDMQDDLFSSGVDRALLVDGAGSIGLYAKSHNRYIRARRHDSPSRLDTVPSYILFKKND